MSQDSRRLEGRQFSPQSIAAAQEKNPFAKISDIVYELLEKAIFSSAIPPGSKLNISKLAEQLVVSTKICSTPLLRCANQCHTSTGTHSDGHGYHGKLLIELQFKL